MANGHLSEIYKMTEEKKALFVAQEYPSDQMIVRILLKKSVSSVLNDLNKRFSTTVDMEASQDDRNKSAIVVRGIRPHDGYGPHDILTVVKNLDRGAKIIP